eukprot:4244839-Pleurochrysis_carterae.AAC.4
MTASGEACCCGRVPVLLQTWAVLRRGARVLSVRACPSSTEAHSQRKMKPEPCVAVAANPLEAVCQVGSPPDQLSKARACHAAAHIRARRPGRVMAQGAKG